ncbi:MAG: GlsB/YeaQ/YmgE family stress response membrane protein [Actinobacteria bacterium]|nr:GlsB/YeaQ/YmgE family stress response membrane protein [Actinomycetota bacterium]
MIGFIIGILLWGLIVRALARLAVPGPDPMPLWATVVLGLAGSVIGGIVVRVIFGGTGAGLVGSVLVSVALLAVYRRRVQNRPFWGPGARRPPGG